MYIAENNEETLSFAGEKRHSRLKDFWRRYRKNKLAVFALLLIAVIVIVVVFANQIAPFDYAKQDLSNTFQYPNWQHLLGTDNFGRDLLSRLIYGGRISLLVSLLALVIAIIPGILLGATAGFIGGAYEGVVMRVMDILMAIPGFLLAVSISAMLGSGIFNTAIAIAVSGLPSYVRLMRGQVLTLKDQEFVEAATALGNSKMRILAKHIIPNTLSPIIVDSTLKIGGFILTISGLSFVGLGVQPPTPEWGSILAAGREYIRDFWPIVTFPGIAIMITMFGFNVMGDGLRDALDPRLKQ